MSNLTTNQIEKSITIDNIIKDIRNLFRLEKKKDKDIKDKVLRDIKTLFESGEEDYYKLIRIRNAFSSNYVEYESNVDKDKTLSIKDYADKIKPYLSDIINYHKTQGEWEIQLTIAINFVSCKDFNETRTMHSKSDNTEIMIGNEADENIEERFDFLLQKYQKGLEQSMKGSEFIFDSVDLWYYKFHKISLHGGGSYIDSPKWLNNKKATINPKNND